MPRITIHPFDLAPPADPGWMIAPRL